MIYKNIFFYNDDATVWLKLAQDLQPVSFVLRSEIITENVQSLQGRRRMAKSGVHFHSDVAVRLCHFPWHGDVVVRSDANFAPHRALIVVSFNYFSAVYFDISRHSMYGFFTYIWLMFMANV